MQLTTLLNSPGEHSFLLPGIVGSIEGILTVPDEVNDSYLAILGHPHSLQGGSMNNKVVTTLARAFKTLHVPSLRFNCRGVGQSAGVYDAGIGESEDMLYLVNHWREAYPDVKLLFAGFSFGSYVAYRAAAQSPHALLMTIAPSVLHYNYAEFTPSPTPWALIMGDEDEVVPLQSVLDFVTHTPAPIVLKRFAETGHFFHGKLIELKAQIIELVTELVGLV